MKYQQLENLESGWRWQYLVSKYKSGENITRFTDSSEIEAAANLLVSCENDPAAIGSWIELHLSPDLENKLKQAIRAKRKRHFDAELPQTRKKSIDLSYPVWERLSLKAKKMNMTLSETVDFLLSQMTQKKQSERTVRDLKASLSQLLKKD